MSDSLNTIFLLYNQGFFCKNCNYMKENIDVLSLQN